MVEFERFMAVGMEKCAPSGEGTQKARREVFAELAETWNQNKDAIKEIDSETELRDRLECP